MGGYTLWARKTLESEIFLWKPKVWFHIWFYIVNAVNWKDDTPIKGFPRGTGHMTYDRIIDATGVSRSTVDHCIRYLKKEQMLATRKATRGMVVTVLKYEEYQDHDNYKSDTKSDLKATQKRHTQSFSPQTPLFKKTEACEEVKKRPNTYSDEHLELARLLESKIKERMPKHKLKGEYIGNWANTVRLMIEQDELTIDEIKDVIAWVPQDDFWCKNILSMDKLRGRFGVLWENLRQSKIPKKTRNPITGEYHD